MDSPHGDTVADNGNPGNRGIYRPDDRLISQAVPGLATEAAPTAADLAVHANASRPSAVHVFGAPGKSTARDLTVGLVSKWERGLHRLTHQAGPAAIRKAALFGFPIEAADALVLHLIDELTTDMAAALAAVLRLTESSSGTELAVRRQLMLEAPAAGAAP